MTRCTASCTIFSNFWIINIWEANDFFLFFCCMFLLERVQIFKKWYVTVSATQFPTNWCPFQPPRSKTVRGDTFLVAKSVTDNAPCLPPDPPLPHLYFFFLISIIEKKNYGNYVEFDFSIGTVLVIFSFFWMDNAPCLLPWSLPICKTFNIHRRKKRFKRKLCEFYFSMGIVLVIFSFFWTVNDLVCVPPPLCGTSHFFQSHNYSHTFAHNSKTTCLIFVKFWEIATNNMTVTNLK